jgi:hypothetical protein
VEVSVNGISNVEPLERCIVLIGDGGRRGADGSSKGRQEGDEAKRDYFEQRWTRASMGKGRKWSRDIVKGSRQIKFYPVEFSSLYRIPTSTMTWVSIRHWDSSDKTEVSNQ